MAVGSGTPYNVHDGNGVTTTFAYGFTVLAAADLVATVDGVPTSVTVNNVGVAAGGTVVFSTAPANGTEVILKRVLTLARLVEYQTNGDLLAATVNADLNRLLMLIQGINADSARSVRAPFPETLNDIPDAVARANTIQAYDGDGQPTVVVPVSGSAADVLLQLASTASVSLGDAMSGVKRTDPGAVALTLHDWIEKLPFRNALSEFGTIQAAIDAANTAGGGAVVLPRKTGGYDLGSTGLTLRSNVKLVGSSDQYGGSSTNGTYLTYSGTGSAISGQSLLNTGIENITVDCTSATGASVRGLYLNGCWRSDFRACTVKGVTRAKGYGILVDTYTAGGPWGAQHNTFDNIECSDGVIRLAGVSGADGVTTTVFNTVRGLQYEIVSSQVVLINATAESWVTGAGYDFSGAGCFAVMIGCDVEGAGSPGIQVASPAEVREIGTVWAGFSGAVRVSGDMAPLRSYGGATDFISDLVASTPKLISRHGNSNTDFVSEYLTPNDIGGGTQDGHREWRRKVAGTERTTHEWRYHAIRQHSKSIANVATAIATIAIPGGAGVSVECVAWGPEAGVSVFSHSCDITAANNSGTVTTPTVSNVSESPAGSGAVFTAAASTSNLVISFNHASATPGTIKFLLVVRGEFTNITLN